MTGFFHRGTCHSQMKKVFGWSDVEFPGISPFKNRFYGSRPSFISSNMLKSKFLLPISAQIHPLLVSSPVSAYIPIFFLNLLFFPSLFSFPISRYWCYLWLFQVSKYGSKYGTWYLHFRILKFPFNWRFPSFMATPLGFSHFTHFPWILGYLHDLFEPPNSASGRDQAEEDQGGPFSAHAGAGAESAAGSDPGVVQMGSFFGS